MGKIVAIGGGECGRPGTIYETEEIDREIITMTNKTNPNFLLIALGNDNPQMYYDTLGLIYKEKFCCCIDQLTREDLRYFEIIKKKIEWADVIYIGGGNSLRLLKLMRKYGVDQLLRDAFIDNKVLCGLSAGAISWCDYGNSHSTNTGIVEKDYIKVRALGLIHIMLCPHFDSDPNRNKSLMRIMKRLKGTTAIALNDCTAIEVIDNKFRIITSKHSGNAFKIYWKDGEYVREILKKNKFMELHSLYIR